MKDNDKEQPNHDAPGDKTPAKRRDNGVLPFADGTHVITDHTKFLKFVGIALVGSFAFAWASIPLYRLVCAKLAPGGSSAQNGTVSKYENVTVDTSRKIHVQLTAFVNNRLPWEFAPTELTVDVHPGEKRLTKFYAKNLSTTDTIVGKGVYDIVPPEAAPYFHKIECFCFVEQTLNPGKSMDMPLYFWFDSDMPDHIKSVTLSYTFFKLKTLDGPVEKDSADSAVANTASAANIASP